jgi:hypothetical protein
MKWLGIFVFTCLIVRYSFGANIERERQQSLTVSYDINKKYAIEELHFDLAILKDALVKTHPGLFWYQTEEEFESTYESVKNAVNRPMTEMEFYNLLALIVSNIKCGHTHLFFSEGFNKYRDNDAKVFPFFVKIIERKIYIAKNLSADTIETYSEIIAINGVSADSLLRIMEPHGFGWTDGYTKSYTRIEEYFEVLLLGIFNYPDKYTLSIIDPFGNPRFLEADALNLKTIEENDKERYPADPKQQTFEFYSLHHEVDSLSVGVIKIEEFLGKGFDKFLSHSFASMERDKIKNLIIDLRGNVGGDSYYPELLYSYIALEDFRFTSRMESTIDNPNDSIFKYGKPEGNVWDYGPVETSPGTYNLTQLPETVLPKEASHPRPNNFTGNVYVLTDVKSYSASASFCAVARYQERATFIGRETGGGYCGNTSSFDFVLTLPNTGIRVAIPLITSYAAVEGPCGRGIKPDYELKEDINDYILNRDSDLLFALRLISGSE